MSTQEPLVTVGLVVFNGSKYIRPCLRALAVQTYKNLEVIIFDNASTDATVQIITQEFPQYRLIRNDVNLGMWVGQEKILEQAKGEWYLVLSTDVLLAEDFIEKAILVGMQDKQIGAVQGKILQWHLDNGEAVKTNMIDTLGFEISHKRRIGNISHGLADNGQHESGSEIFAVEGAVPLFRTSAMRDTLLDGHLIDPNFFWYGEDLDFAWRLRLRGWRQVYVPQAVAWHDRQTTQRTRQGWSDFIKQRRSIPLHKRRLGWRNTTLSIISNDHLSNLGRDLIPILGYHLPLWLYFTFFEPSMYLELLRVLKLLPQMLARRRKIMQGSKVSAKDMRKWFKD